jgi:hypothetical protein
MVVGTRRLTAKENEEEEEVILAGSTWKSGGRAVRSKLNCSYES